MGPSSGETTVFLQHLILVILCGWLSGSRVEWIPSCIPDSHPHRITSTKCRINTVVSPDDGPIVSRNMLRLININIRRINCAPSWFYLQDCHAMLVRNYHYSLLCNSQEQSSSLLFAAATVKSYLPPYPLARQRNLHVSHVNMFHWLHVSRVLNV